MEVRGEALIRKLGDEGIPKLSALNKLHDAVLGKDAGHVLRMPRVVEVEEAAGVGDAVPGLGERRHPLSMACGSRDGKRPDNAFFTSLQRSHRDGLVQAQKLVNDCGFRQRIVVEAEGEWVLHLEAVRAAGGDHRGRDPRKAHWLGVAIRVRGTRLAERLASRIRRLPRHQQRRDHRDGHANDDIAPRLRHQY
eukprot:scaffold207_cov267-Pinguiococcus_pyrenoidosus.AAC.34